MLTPFYKDIPLYLILTVIVYQIFVFQFEYSFALSLTTTIPVQNDPRYSAFDDQNNKIYVTNHDSAKVSVIDAGSDMVIKNITVGNDPFHLIYASTSNGEKIYVANIDFSNTVQDTISVISTSIDEVIATIPLPMGVDPQFLLYNPDNQKVYVSDQGSQRVSVIDTVTDTVEKTILLGQSGPSHMAYDSINKKLYVVNILSDSVSIIDTNSNILITTISLGGDPRFVVFDSIHEKMYVANLGLDNIAVIDSQSDQLLYTISGISDPIGMAFDPLNSKMYVRTSSISSMPVINTTTDALIAPLPIGNVRYLIYEPNYQILYVAHDSHISAINTANDQIQDTVNIETSPVYIEYNDIEGKIYSVNSGDNSVSVIDAFLDTKILQVKDGNGNMIDPEDTINSNSLNITVEARNQFDVDGVICYLNGELYEGCEQFDDPPGDDPENDLKVCMIQQGDVEVCTFTIPINNLVNGHYVFSVATFEEVNEVELSTINDKMSSSQFFPLLKKQTSNEQRDNGLSLLNSNSSSDIKVDKHELPTTLSSFTLPLEFSFFPIYPNMFNFNNLQEKLTIQHNPEVDNIIFDSDLPTFTWHVLQSLGSDCDRCFASENMNGTLPPPRVAELEAYLADPDNIVPIGADPDVNSIAELCAAIVAAVGTGGSSFRTRYKRSYK